MADWVLSSAAAAKEKMPLEERWFRVDKVEGEPERWGLGWLRRAYGAAEAGPSSVRSENEDRGERERLWCWRGWC
jgi:hypothetical protein